MDNDARGERTPQSGISAALPSESASEGLIVVESDGAATVVSANSTAVAQLPGTKPGIPLASLLVWNEGEQLRDGSQMVRSTDAAATRLFTLSVGSIDIEGRPVRICRLRGLDAEAALRAELRMFSEAVHHSPASVVVTDPSGHITFVNPKFSEVTGYSADEVLGRNPRVLKSGLTPKETYRNLWTTIAAGRVWRGEFVNRKKDGSLYWEAAAIAPVADPDGRVSRFVAVKEDITERKRAEDALSASESRYRAIVSNSAVAIALTDLEGRFTQFNEAWPRMLGYTPDELTRLSNADVTHPDDRKNTSDHLHRLVAGEIDTYRLEKRYVRKDGGVLWGDLSVSPILDVEGRATEVIGVIRDITDSKQVERALVRSEKNLRAILDNMIDVFYRTDRDGRVVMVSRAVKRLLGYEPAEILWTRLTDYYVSPSDRSRFLAALEESGGRIDGYETLLRHKDGHEVWVATNASYYLDDKGHIAGVEGTTRDISRRKQDEEELKRAKAAAEAANRAKSDFLSGMSHELRTPMNAILGFCQLMRYDPKSPPTDRQSEYLDLVLRSGNHLLDLINEVLDLAGIEAGKVRLSIERINVSDLVGDCLDLIRPLADKRGIRLAGDLSPGEVPDIRADYRRAKQILVNLLSNAVKYNREQGSVTVTAEAIDGHRLRLAITDTGPGIAPEDREKLFEPFERLTAGEGTAEGTGIGLTLTRRLTEMMGGSIGVESAPGEGSTFWITLPLHVGRWTGTPQPHEDGGDQAPTALPGGFRMLYIEDNPVNLRLMNEVVSRLPEVRLASAYSAEIGLDLLREENPDLIVLDIDLPGMSGFDALKQIRADKTFRHLPVMALSADAAPNTIARGHAAGFDAYLTKPFDIKEFLATVDDLLKKAKDGKKKKKKKKKKGG